MIHVVGDRTSLKAERVSSLGPMGTLASFIRIRLGRMPRGG